MFCSEIIWEMDEVEHLTIGLAWYFEINKPIHWLIIDCWAALLNKLEEFKSVEAPKRLFLNTHFMVNSNYIQVEYSLIHILLYE